MQKNLVSLSFSLKQNWFPVPFMCPSSHDRAPFYVMMIASKLRVLNTREIRDFHAFFFLSKDFHALGVRRDKLRYILNHWIWALHK